MECPYKHKCWRHAYTKYILELDYKTDIPIRFELFYKGYVTQEMMAKNGRGGIYAELMPYSDSEGMHNLCPFLNLGIFDQCGEYTKELKRVHKVAKKPNPYARRREWIPREVRCQVAAKANYKCRYCGQSARVVKTHVDHIVPISKGGSDDIDNLCLACEACNLKKSDKVYNKSKCQTSDEGVRH